MVADVLTVIAGGPSIIVAHSRAGSIVFLRETSADLPWGADRTTEDLTPADREVGALFRFSWETELLGPIQALYAFPHWTLAGILSLLPATRLAIWLRRRRPVARGFPVSAGAGG